VTPDAPEPASRTHGPMILIQGSCATCEFRWEAGIALSMCDYVSPSREIPNRELVTPTWCPLLQDAYENFAAEVQQKSAE